MDFSIPAALQSTLDAIDQLVTTQVRPAEVEVLHKGFTASAPLLESLRGKVKAAGLWAPQVPKDLGGMGLSLVEHALVSERLGRSPIAHYVFGAQAPDAGEDLVEDHRHAAPAALRDHGALIQRVHQQHPAGALRAV